MRWAGYCCGATAHVSGRRQAKITWQLLGEASIDGDAPGSVSIWTRLTRSHTKAFVTRCHAGVRCSPQAMAAFLFSEAPGEHLHRHSNYLFAAIFKAHLNTSPTLPQIKVASTRLQLLQVTHQVSRVARCTHCRMKCRNKHGGKLNYKNISLYSQQLYVSIYIHMVLSSFQCLDNKRYSQTDAS